MQRLYLSRNRLVHLEGIQQFINLQALSVSNNYLASFTALSPVRHLRTLEAVSFDGNPLADLPYYRAHVITILNSRLQQLDGKVITEIERATAGDLLAIERELHRLAARHACILNKLAHDESPLDSFNTASMQEADMWKKKGSCKAKSASTGDQAPQDLTRHINWTQEVQQEASERQRFLMDERIRQQVVKIRFREHPGALLPWHNAYCCLLAAQIDAIAHLCARDQSPVSDTILRHEKTPENGTDWGSVCGQLHRTIQDIAAIDVRSMTVEASRQIVELVRFAEGVLDGLERGKVNIAEEKDVGWLIPAGESSASPFKLDEEETGDVVALQELEGRLLEAQWMAESYREDTVSALAANTLLTKELEAREAAICSLEAWLSGANRAAEEAKTRVLAVESETLSILALKREEITALESRNASLESEVAGANERLDAAMMMIVENDGALVELHDQLHDLCARMVADSTPPEVSLKLEVSFEEELEEERYRSAMLELRLAEDERRIAQYQDALERMKQADRDVSISAWRRWRQEIARQHRLRAFEAVLVMLNRRLVASRGLFAWKLATDRVRGIKKIERRRDSQLRARAWRQWQCRTRREAILLRLEHAADAVARASLLRLSTSAWRQVALSQCQRDIPLDEPWMVTHRWRISLAHKFAQWRYTAVQESRRRRAAELLAVAHDYSKTSILAMDAWKAAAVTAREEKEDEERGTMAYRLLILHRTLSAWVAASRREAALAVARAHLSRIIRQLSLHTAMRAWVRYTEARRAQHAACMAQQQSQALHAWRRSVILSQAEKIAECKTTARDMEAVREALTAWRAVIWEQHRSIQRAGRARAKMRFWTLKRILQRWRHVTVESHAEKLTFKVAALSEHICAACLAIGAGETCAGELGMALITAFKEIDKLKCHLKGTHQALECTRVEADDLQRRLESAKGERDVAQVAWDAACLEAKTAIDLAQEVRSTAAEAIQTAELLSISAREVAERDVEGRVQVVGAERDWAQKRFKESNACEELKTRCEMLRIELKAAQSRETGLQRWVAHAAHDAMATQERLQKTEGNLEILRERLEMTQEELQDAMESKILAEEETRAAVRHTHRLAELVAFNKTFLIE